RHRAGVPALLRVPWRRRRPELAPCPDGAVSLALSHPGHHHRRVRPRGRGHGGSHRTARLRAGRGAGDVADGAVRAGVRRTPVGGPGATDGDARDHADGVTVTRAGGGGRVSAVQRLLVVLIAVAAGFVWATEPPACTVADVPAPAASPARWADTVLDTHFVLPPEYAPADLVPASAAVGSSAA